MGRGHGVGGSDRDGMGGRGWDKGIGMGLGTQGWGRGCHRGLCPLLSSLCHPPCPPPPRHLPHAEKHLRRLGLLHASPHDQPFFRLSPAPGSVEDDHIPFLQRGNVPMSPHPPPSPNPRVPMSLNSHILVSPCPPILKSHIPRPCIPISHFYVTSTPPHPHIPRPHVPRSPPSPIAQSSPPCSDVPPCPPQVSPCCTSSPCPSRGSGTQPRTTRTTYTLPP